MDNNSYAQLIDDFEKGLLVLEGESLTDYITRMGGVDYESKANGGIMGRVGYAQGGVQYAPTTASRMQNAQSTSPTISQTTGGIQSVPTTHMRNIQQRQVQSMTPEQFIAANSKPGSQNTPTSLLNLFYKNSPLIAPAGVLSLAEMEAKRNRILAEQKAQQKANSGLADPITGKRYMSEQEAIDDLGIVVYNQRFAEGGRVGFALGGMRTQDLSSVYDSSSVLQDKYATQQDYLDLFDNSNTTTTTPQYATAYQSTGSINPINPIKPILPILPTDGGDGGGGPPPGPKGNSKFDYEFDALGGLYNKDNVPLTEEEQEIVDKEKSGLMNLLSLSPTLKAGKFVFNKAKAGAAATKKTIDDYFAKKAAEKAAAAAEISRIQQIIDSGSSVDRATGGQFGSSVNEATGSRGSGTGFSNYT